MWIETRRLVIRNLRTEDGRVFAEMAADGSLHDIGFGRDCSGWMEEWVAEAKRLASGDNPAVDYLAYAVALKDDDRVVGSVGCSWYEDLRETGITYFIGAQYRGNGYALEAAEAYLRYFFGHYHAERMIATVSDENVPSWKVAERAGFTLTDKRMYKDLNDEKEELCRFYVMEKGNFRPT